MIRTAEVISLSACCLFLEYHCKLPKLHAANVFGLEREKESDDDGALELIGHE
jgi:hypothetical protein